MRVTSGSFFLILLTLCCMHCNPDTDDKNPTPSHFIEAENNIEFINQLHYRPDLNIIEYLYYYNGGGVAIGDIDQDGLEDIYFTANQGPDKLYRNKGELQFEDISSSAGIQQDSSWSSGVSIDDINQDGLLDIHVCQVDFSNDESTHNLLYINQGDGSFIELAGEHGLDFSGYSTQASFFDMDLDGDLDMYLLNHTEHSTSSYGSITKRSIADPRAGDRLYENMGKAEAYKFKDITAESGIYSSALGYGLAVTTTDLNADGYPDIYVGNDFHENDYLYINQQDKSFKESIGSWVDHSSQFTMGVDAADLNQDGRLDLFTADMMPYDPQIRLKSGGNDSEVIAKIKKDFGFHKQYARNHLLINHCEERLTDWAYLTGTFATDWSWSPLIQDYNNDGTNDIFISNGIVKRPNDLDYINFINTPNNRQLPEESIDQYHKRLIDKMPALALENILFTQHQDFKFSELNHSKVGSPTYSNGAAYADLDQDGILEIVSNNINDRPTILKSQSTQHFVSFHLSDARQTTTKGTIIRVHAGGQQQMREAVTTRGFQSSSSHLVHFGLGDIPKIDSVEITWPDRTAQVLYNVSIDQRHKVIKAATETSRGKKTCGLDSPFTLQKLPVSHVENAYNDLENEPLMPRSYAAEGPAFISHDFDQDGYGDIYLGGARGQAPQLLMGAPDYAFRQAAQQVFQTDAYYEDVDAALLDYNGDGHQDLYVISGGNDKNQLDKALQDRIYINDGKGNFKRLPVSLPHMNGSTISIADYNKDGFDDMFVGTLNVPGAYGVAPVSFILENQQGHGVRIAHRSKLGMITDASWLDIDSDGVEELLVTGEWMGLRVLDYDGDSSFVASDLDLFSIPIGQYRDIEIADLNDDGMPDYSFSNLGINTQWRQGPVSLYLGDFDDNDFIDPIIFENYGGANIPFAAKSDLERQVPSIRKKHSGYHSFSQVSDLEQLTNNKSALKKEYHLSELATYTMLSGPEAYEQIKLPDVAQLSPTNQTLWLEHILGGSLLVCSHDQHASHLMGTSEGFPAILFSGYDDNTKTFEKQYPVNLPVGTSVKKAIEYDEDTIILATHNGPLYMLRFE